MRLPLAGKWWGMAVLAAVLLRPAYTYSAEPFDAWLETVRAEAIAEGVRPETVADALGRVRQNPRVLVLDQRQPELLQPFWQYLDARVTPARGERARQMLEQHRDLLDRVQRLHGVQPRFLVAFWALESSFGEDTGNFDLIDALATLAHDGRRSAFFRGQLVALLQLIDRGDIGVTARGSWAGAMGQPQFMPTTYKDFAVDADGDGRRDLWRSLPDVFASAANYLAQSGWRPDETWGREVALPAEFDLALSGPEITLPLAEWQRLGVRLPDGADLPQAGIEASLLLPAGIGGGPALLIYPNFQVIMTWNRSLLYAVAVGHLADRMAGGPAFSAPRPVAEANLSRSDVLEVQVMLARLGFDAGSADGILGTKTRSALQSFQRSRALPADGFPSAPVIEHLRAVVSP